MSTGWKWILSDGQTFRNQMEVKKALQQNPALTVTFSELSMAGTKLTDVTEQFKQAIEKSNDQTTS